MKYRTLPGTDLQLSAIGFGCWAIGKTWWGDDVDDPTSIDAVHAALDHGINWFDTAPLYGHGHADEILAQALAGRRHEVVIATKVGIRWDGEGAHARSDLRPDHVVADCEASLKRLGLDTIPLLQVHWPCQSAAPIDATLEALTQLRQAGKIRWFGVCNYNAETLTDILKIAPEGLACLQTPFSMLRREFNHGLRDVVAPEPSAPRLGVLAYETLARGLLTGKYRGLLPPTFPDTDLRARDDRFQQPLWAKIQPLVRALVVVAERLHVPPAALAVAWACRQPGISVAIVGAKRRAQVEEHVRALELLARERVWQALAPHIEACRP